MDPLSFQTLFDECSPNAQSECGVQEFPLVIDHFLLIASIPLAVKREFMALIRQYLDKQFE
jgi:hypothetical protein